jgi:MFS family permease
MFGSLLLIPLYFQSVRGASALEAGLLLAPQGFGAMITMPIAGRLTDRYGPSRWAAFGLPLLIVGLAPFAFVQADTSYVLLCSFMFIAGLGMGLSMMPTMTAAMQAVPPAAIARTSTAMNIIRQSGASIGTAILSVLLSTAITANLAGLGGGGGQGSGFEALNGLSAARRETVAEPLSEAFASTFVWGLVLMGLAFIPALWMAVTGGSTPARAPGAIPDQAATAVE